MAGLGSKLRHAWNAFVDSPGPKQIDLGGSREFGPSYGIRPDRTRMLMGNERSIIASIYARLSVDVASATINHVRVDEDGRFLEVIKSGLNYCLTIDPNLDQGPRQFRQDMALTTFDKGTCAVVAVETTQDPFKTNAYDVKQFRVGEIVQWHPRHVKVSVYNEDTGRRENLILLKTQVAIVENPLYAVMNETNSTLQRIIHKLGLLDIVDNAASSGKLDLIIQLPYMVKSDLRQKQAEQRRADLEVQLMGSKYGVAWTDATEKVTQLNRPVENNLLKEIEFLLALLYSQLGLTEDVMNGTADEATMLNYHERVIAPVLDAITEAMQKTFLSKTALTQDQRIIYTVDPFKFVPIAQMAEIADKFTRNEIASSNEIRQAVRLRPSKDPKADELRNSNMPLPPPGTSPSNPIEKDEVTINTRRQVAVDTHKEGDSQNGSS